MLTVEEVQGNLNLFHLFSRLHLVPFHVNRNTGQIHIYEKEDRRSWRLWKVNFTIGILQWIFMLFRLGQIVYDPGTYLKFNHLPLHLGFSLFFGVGIFWTVNAYLINGDLTVTIFNCLLRGGDDVDSRNKTNVKSKGKKINKNTKEAFIIVGSSSNINNNNENNNNNNIKTSPPPRTLKNFKEFSKQEFYTVCLPYLVYLGLLGYSGLHLYDPTYNHFLCSVILEYIESKSRYRWFVPLFTILEYWLTLFWSTTAFLAFLFIIFFDKITNRTQIGIKHLSSSLTGNSWLMSHRLSICYQDAREIQLLIQCFNHTFAYVIFSGKVLSMTISIILWTFSIRLIQIQDSDPLKAAFYAFCASQFQVGFVACFEKAFSIPKALQKYKKTIAKAASKINPKAPLNIAQAATQLNVKNHRYDYERAIASIPNKCGIRVGHFNYLERAVTLGFLNFVAKNVFKLLITLRK